MQRSRFATWLVALSMCLTAGCLADTVRVSVDSEGTEGTGDSSNYGRAISADGRYVAFESGASNLVPEDTNGSRDIFVHDCQTGQTTRVSVDSAGNQVYSGCSAPCISADGRHVAFDSQAGDLVPGDTNGLRDVFVHDRQTGATTRVSVDSGGVEGDGASFAPSISGDGRYVAFDSSSSNLAPGDNGHGGIFVHDRQTGQTTRVSVDSAGAQGNLSSSDPSISEDGRYVAFLSSATNLVPGDTNGYQDVFVHDCQTGETTRVSVDSAGGEANWNSGGYGPSVSRDGRYVAFDSLASNLVSGDTKGYRDVFVHDRQTGQTTRVSVDSAGGEADQPSGDFGCSISGDGQFVAFESYASNLVPGDTGGIIDAFVHDCSTGQTVRVSVAGDGTQGDRQSGAPAIAADAPWLISFHSYATNLVPNDTNGQRDVFLTFQQPLAARWPR
jgi:Tol biopolymer transport system component